MSETADKPKAAAKATDPAKTATEVAAAPAAAKKRAVVIDPQRMQNAEYLRRDWVLTAEEGTTVDDVLDPSYWAHVAGQLTEYDRIEVRVDTGEYLLEMLVKQKGRNWAQVALLHHHDLVGDVKTGDVGGEEFEAIWKGPLLKWCAMRKADKQILEQKLGSREAAMAWINSYERTVLAR
jgi:hypothetical protein